MTAREEQDIINEVQKGNVQAYALLVKRYQSMAYTIAYKITNNREDAEEAIQDAFLKAFKAINSFKGNSKFSTWLYRIAYTTAISKTRNHKRVFCEIENVSNFENPFSSGELKEYSIDNVERKKYLELAMDKLSVEEQVIITLYYYEDKKVEEVGIITNNTIPNTKIKLFRARKKMLDVLHKSLKTEVKDLL